MPAKNFYNYCNQSFSEASRALLELVKAKEKVIAKDQQAAGGICGYAEAVYQLSKDDNNLLVKTNRALIKFFESEVVDAYVQNPLDNNFKRALAREIILIYLATGNPLAAEVYSVEQIQQIVAGKKNDYEDSILIRTLGKILYGQLPPDAYAPFLLGFLRPAGGTEARDNLDWNTAFILALNLHVLWNNLESVPPPGQQLLLQNYLYLGAVAGVPVFDILSKFFVGRSPVEMNNAGSFLFESLQDNIESVPANTNLQDWQSALGVCEKFFAHLQGKLPDGFAQEEFINEFYTNQPNRDVFKEWLREVLKVYFFL